MTDERPFAATTFAYGATSTGVTQGTPLNVPQQLASAKLGLRPLDVRGNVFPAEHTQELEGLLSQARQARQYYSAKAPGFWAPDQILSVDNHGLGSILMKKLATWAAGKSIEFRPTKDNMDEADTVAAFFSSNGGRKLIYQFVLNGLLDGTAYWHPYVKTYDILGRELPAEQYTLGIQRLPFSNCFPLWNPNVPGVMDAALIQFPTYAPSGRGSDFRESRLFSRIYTRDSMRTYLDYELVSEVANPLGVVPIVAGAFNNDETVSNFGTSAMWPLIPEMKRLAELAASKDNVVHYHAMPTILLFGASVSSAERSARAIWSFSEKDAKAEMLKLDAAALTPLQEEVLGQILYILQLAQVPPIALGPKEIKLSGVSAQTLAILFGPLLEATMLNQENLKVVISRMVALMVLCLEVYLRKTGLSQYNWNVDPVFTSLLPKDEPAEFDLAIKKKEAGVLSTQEMIRRFAGVNDNLRLRQELAADQMQELAMVREKAAALNGGAMNPLAALLGSPFIDYASKELLGVAEKDLQAQVEGGKGSALS